VKEMNEVSQKLQVLQRKKQERDNARSTWKAQKEKATQDIKRLLE